MTIPWTTFLGPKWSHVVSEALSETGISLTTSAEVWSVGGAPTRLASLVRVEATNEICLRIRLTENSTALSAAEAILHELAHYESLREHFGETLRATSTEKLSDHLDGDDETECYWTSLNWVETFAPEKAPEYATEVLKFLSEVSDSEDLLEAYSMTAGRA